MQYPVLFSNLIKWKAKGMKNIRTDYFDETIIHFWKGIFQENRFIFSLLFPKSYLYFVLHISLDGSSRLVLPPISWWMMLFYGWLIRTIGSNDSQIVLFYTLLTKLINWWFVFPRQHSILYCFAVYLLQRTVCNYNLQRRLMACWKFHLFSTVGRICFPEIIFLFEITNTKKQTTWKF